MTSSRRSCLVSEFQGPVGRFEVIGLKDILWAMDLHRTTLKPMKYPTVKLHPTDEQGRQWIPAWLEEPQPSRRQLLIDEDQLRQSFNLQDAAASSSRGKGLAGSVHPDDT